MSIEKQLFEAAKSLIELRYPNGWGGAAAMYSLNGLSSFKKLFFYRHVFPPM